MIRRPRRPLALSSPLDSEETPYTSTASVAARAFVYPVPEPERGYEPERDSGGGLWIEGRLKRDHARDWPPEARTPPRGEASSKPKRAELDVGKTAEGGYEREVRSYTFEGMDDARGTGRFAGFSLWRPRRSDCDCTCWGADSPRLDHGALGQCFSAREDAEGDRRDHASCHGLIVLPSASPTRVPVAGSRMAVRGVVDRVHLRGGDLTQFAAMFQAATPIQARKYEAGGQ